MADKTEKKKGTKAPRVEKTAQPRSEIPPEIAAEAAPGATSPAKPEGKGAAAASAPPPRCAVAKCKQPVRAKGYCRKHYFGWRRGEVGKKHRYKICSKEACRKPAVEAGLCEEHKRGASPAPEAPSP
jgi:hypothetical protein